MTPRPLASFLSRLIWLSVLPPVLVAAWLAVDTVLDRQEQTRQQATALAGNFATAIDHHLQARIRALNMLAISPLADNPEQWPELYAEARGFHASFGSHVILADTGEPMRMLFNTRTPFGTPLPPLPRPAGHAAAPAALATGEPAVGDTFMGPIAGVPLVAIAVPGKRNGQVTHLVLAILETSQFQRRLERETLPDHWALTLKDSRGEVIARRAPAGFDGPDAPEGARYVAPSTVSPWSVVVEIPRAALDESLLEVTIGLAGIVAASGLVGLLAGRLAGRRLGRQVAALGWPALQGDAEPEIAEVAAVRRLLDDTTANLRASEQRFATVVEQAPFGIGLMDLDGRFFQANRSLCAMLAFNRDDLLQKTWQELAHEDDRATELELIRRLIDGELDAISREKRFDDGKGRTFWANSGLILIRTPDGRPDFLAAVVEDIQGRKDIEATLIERDQLLTDMAAMARVGGWSFDPATGKGQWTAETARIHDLPADASTDVTTGLSYYVGEHRVRIEAALQDAVNHGIPYDLELELHTPTGRRKWVRTIGHPVLAGTRVVQMRGSIQDITEIKRVMTELQHRNEELEAFNRAAVGRELHMIELKRRINELSVQLGQQPPHDLSFTEVA